MARLNTILVAFVAVAVVLVVALAYNIGGTTEETRALKMGAITRKRMASIRERLAKCTVTNKANDEGQLSKESIQRFLSETNQNLQNENVLFLQQNEQGVHLLEECTKHLRDVREETTGAAEANATQLVAELEDERARLERAIADANETKELNHKELRRLTMAYKLEMSRIVESITKRQRLLREKALNASRARREAATTEALTTTTATPTATTNTTANTTTATAAVMTPEVGQNKTPTEQQTASESTSTTTMTTVAPVQSGTCDAMNRYSIMMDAGSTGSRTHIYHFQVLNGTLTLKSEVFEALKPGLSSFKDDPEEAAKSLVPLMELAVKSVPAEYRVCTPVALKATAGLRLLGEEKSAAILNKVGQLLRQYPFTVGSDAAIVMDAADEGPYAWLTVNFLLGNVKPGARTVAIMDMGGASTQVVFAPDDAAVLDAAPKGYVYEAKVAGAALRAYQHSFLGLGLKEAGSTLVKAAAAVGGDFVCFPKDHTQEVGDKVVTNGGASNFDECVQFVQDHLVRRPTDDAECTATKACPFRGVHLPDMTATFKGPVYAFSYFYDRMEPFFVSPDETFTVSSFRTVGRQVCESTEEKYASKNKGTMCMDLAFLYSILRHGYKLEDSRELLIKKKIDGYETAWPLGASLVTALPAA